MQGNWWWPELCKIRTPVALRENSVGSFCVEPICSKVTLFVAVAHARTRRLGAASRCLVAGALHAAGRLRTSLDIALRPRAQPRIWASSCCSAKMQVSGPLRHVALQRSGRAAQETRKAHAACVDSVCYTCALCMRAHSDSIPTMLPCQAHCMPTIERVR